MADRIAQTPPPPKDPEAEEFDSQTDRLAAGRAVPDDANGADPEPGASKCTGANPAVTAWRDRRRAPRQEEASWDSKPVARASGPAYSTPFGRAAAIFGTPASICATEPRGPSPSGAPSFLRGAAQTAAGVAAGAFAFEGIQALFSHPGYGGGGFRQARDLWAALRGETIVNNYYDTPGGVIQLGQGNDVYAPDDTTNFDDTEQCPGRERCGRFVAVR